MKYQLQYYTQPYSYQIEFCLGSLFSSASSGFIGLGGGCLLCGAFGGGPILFPAGGPLELCETFMAFDMELFSGCWLGDILLFKVAGKDLFCGEGPGSRNIVYRPGKMSRFFLGGGTGGVTLFGGNSLLI